MNFEQVKAWGDESDTEDGALPGSKLYAEFICRTCRFHAQAYELKYVDDGRGAQIQVVADPCWKDEWEGIWASVGSNDPWDTLEINGRMYGIVIYPFCNGTEHTTLTRVK